MIVSSKGEITDAIEVPDDMGIFKYYKVLVYTGQEEDRVCVGEEDFKEYPTNAQVVWAVGKNGGSYAEVSEIYVPQRMSEDVFCDGCCCECDKNDGCYD